MGIISKVWWKLDQIGVLNFIPDKLYLKIGFKINMRYKLNLKVPKTFSEKLQWLKLNNRKDIYTTMADKFLSKKYVSSVIGEKYIINTLGIYNNFDEINFELLPNKFVIKCTHDSGGVFICKDKKTFNYDEVRRLVNKRLKKNYYFNGREWPYKNIKPKIIIEEFINDSISEDLKDYKIFCFNGEPLFFKIDFDRFVNHRANYYNLNKEIIKIGESLYPPDFERKIEMPHNLELMLELSKKLSKDIPFLRVDLYEVNGKVYFGELTFFPSSGLSPFLYDMNDIELGNMLDLSKII